MNAEQFEQTLRRMDAGVFILADAARVIQKPTPYCKLYLARLKKTGRIRHIERGKYALSDTDLHAVASSIAHPSYLSFLSALSFHHLTTQIPIVEQVAVVRPRKPLDYAGTKIQFICLKKEAFFGFSLVDGVRVADPEKAILDSLYLPEQAPLSETLQALRQADLDLGKLAEYAERLDSGIVNKRLGFLLGKAGIFYNFKLPHNRKNDPINPSAPARGPVDKRWNLIINEVLE